MGLFERKLKSLKMKVTQNLRTKMKMQWEEMLTYIKKWSIQLMKYSLFHKASLKKSLGTSRNNKCLLQVVWTKPYLNKAFENEQSLYEKDEILT